MRATVLYAPGDIRLEEFPTPQIKSDEVLVKVNYVGICGSDIDRIMKTGAHKMPLIPGHEFSGEIVSIPKDYVGDLEAGQHIVCTPILPCRICPACQSGNFGLCSDYDYIGSRRNGAMAEYVAVPITNILKIPKGVSFIESAMLEPSAVTLHGMRIIGVSAGDSVIVLGCGTIGLMAIEFSKIMGATTVIASDISKDKRELALKLGADYAVDPLNDDLKKIVMDLTNNLGCDIVIETAGSPYTQSESPIYAKFRGKILLLGTAHKEIVFSPNIYEKILRMELTLKGSWNSFSAPFPGSEWTTSIEYIKSGRLNLAPLVSDIIPLKLLPETIEKMSKGEIKFTKVLVDCKAF